MATALQQVFPPEQAYALEHEVFKPLDWTQPWQRFFLIATGVLATTILLKVVAIQWLELLYLFQILLITLNFIRHDLRATGFKPLLWLGAVYFIIMVAALALSVAALRFTFYLPVGLPWFVSPFYITLSRVVELFASVVIMLWLANLFRLEPNKLRLTMRVFFWTGVVSTMYCYIGWPFQRYGNPLYGVYLLNSRFRGFYNEGGPYGLYLMTVLFVGIALHQLGWEPLTRLRIGLALLPVAIFKSYSKAAFSAILLLLLINGLFTRGGLVKRIAILGSMAVFVLVVAQNFNPTTLLSFVDSNNASYERESHYHVGDGNYVLGRVAARFIIPRMIAAHPLTGIGWGNYGVLRNDPQYRGASVWSDIADAPALGALAYAAELGIPLLCVLSFALLLPYFYLRFRRAPQWLTNLALMSPLVHLFGAQLNVTYPWIVTAFALGLGYSGTAQPKLQPADQPLQLSWTETPDELDQGHPA